MLSQILDYFQKNHNLDLTDYDFYWHATGSLRLTFWDDPYERGASHIAARQALKRAFTFKVIGESPYKMLYAETSVPVLVDCEGCLGDDCAVCAGASYTTQQASVRAEITGSIKCEAVGETKEIKELSDYDKQRISETISNLQQKLETGVEVSTKTLWSCDETSLLTK